MGMAGLRRNLGRFIAGEATQREVKESRAMGALVQFGNFTPRWMQQDYVSVAREGYGRNPYVFASIRQIAMAAAGISWVAYTDDTRKTKLDQHPILDLLKQPNPRQGHAVFWEAMIAYLMLDGNSFIERVGPDNGPPKELYVQRPDRMQIVVGNQVNPIAGYVYTVGNFKVPYPEPFIHHFKFFNPLDDWRGMSPIQAAAQSITQSNAARTWNTALLQNGARPPGALVTEINLEPDQFDRLESMIQQEYAGVMNAGRPMILEGGVKWQEMGMSPNDMHWIEGQKLSAREVAIVYNVAPELIGDSENKTYSNYGEARKALYQENVLPLSDWIGDDLNGWLSPLYDDSPYIAYDPDDIEALQEDQDAVYGRNDKSFVAGWITINDARKAAKLDEDEKKGDQYSWEVKAAAAPKPTVTEDPNKPDQIGDGGAVPQLNGPKGASDSGQESESGGADANIPPAKGGGEGATGGTATKTVIPFARGRAKSKAG